jgi:hypothetical protein
MDRYWSQPHRAFAHRSRKPALVLSVGPLEGEMEGLDDPPTKLGLDECEP